MSLPRPSDVPALSTLATLPEVVTYSYCPAIVLAAMGEPAPLLAAVNDPPDDPVEDERLATWARVLP